MKKSLFKVLHRSKLKKSKARLGEIRTAYGIIKTPSFVPVATKGTLKAMPPQFIKDIGIQLAFVNTYHLVTHPGPDLIAKAGGIHNFAKLNIPLMSDSGGFQVFSLAKNSRKAEIRGEEQPLVTKLSDDGVTFRSTFDGSTIEFTPEKSMEYQMKIGADLLMAFDECTYYPSTHQYAEKAMERTHKWLLRCIKYKNFQFSNSNFQSNSNVPMINENSMKIENGKLKMEQYLYGIIQGATFEDLRKRSAEFIAGQPVDGVAIGGVSVGETKQEMREQVKWVSDFLPKDKPVHLLGVGHIDDILDLVKYGIDTFDCVEPTRLARMGVLYQLRQILSQFSFPPGFASLHAVGSPSYCATCRNYDIDINKTVYKADLSPVDEDCDCYVCQNFTKAYLHHLFKQKEILGYTLATYHNLWVMEKLFRQIRKLIEEDKI